MAIELVTGKKGTVHVDSADDGALYAAIAGKGEYVLDLDDRLACTMTTANKAHVASGHGLMQGRHWLIDAEGVDLTIQNGTQGQKRNDLIVARYECDAKNGNIESVALKVIKGTPTTGTPADPACTRGDILEGAALVNEQPLWRIPLNGITVGTPIQMFDVLTPAKEAWDSVAQAVVKAAKVVLDNFRTSPTVVVTVPVAWPVDVSRVVAVVPSYVCQEYSDRIVVSDWGADGMDVRAGVDQNVSMTLHVLYV